MYDELLERLREEASGWCANCCYRCGDNVCGAPDDRKNDCDIASKLQAADAIEELSAYTELYQNLTEKSQQTVRKVIDAYPKWISVEKDGLPSEPNEYLVYVRDGITDKQTDIPDLDIDLSYVTTAYFDPDTCLWNENQEYYNGNLECVNRNKVCYISHWANKPKPPKEANNEL